MFIISIMDDASEFIDDGLSIIQDI